MTPETLKKYVEVMTKGNIAFQAMAATPLGKLVLASPNLRYRINPNSDNVAQTKDTLWEKPTAQNIAAFLRLNGHIIDYDNRSASNDGGKNYRKIGKILNDLNPRLLLSWKKLTNASPVTTNNDMSWVISANPVDIVRASYKRKWTSCLSGGYFFRDIDSHKFSLIAYLCDETDVDIRSPKSRTLIHVGLGWDGSYKPTSQEFSFLETDDTPFKKFKVQLAKDITKSVDRVCMFFPDTIYGASYSGYTSKIRQFLHRMNVDTLTARNLSEVRVAICGLYNNSLADFKTVKAEINGPRSVKSKPTHQEKLHRRCLSFNRYGKVVNYVELEYLTKNPLINPHMLRVVLGTDKKKLFISNVNIDEQLNDINSKMDTIKSRALEMIGGKDKGNAGVLHKIANDLDVLEQQKEKLQEIAKIS